MWKDAPFAWLATESGKYINLREEHQQMVQKLFRLIETRDAEVKSVKQNRE